MNDMSGTPEGGLYELDRSLVLAHDGKGGWQGETSPAYGNRVGPYGGWIAALLLKAILDEKPQGEPLSLTVTFLGGCADGALTGSTRLLRRSRTNEHWTAEFSDSAGAAVAHAVASFGLRRPTVTIGNIAPPAPAPEPDSIPPRPSFGSNGPGFFNRYDARQFVGLPFKSGTSSESRAWVKDADNRPLDWVSLAAQADAPIPRIFLVTARPSPIATLSMSVYFHATPEAFAEVGGDYILIDAICNSGHDGFHDQSVRLWSRSGKLLATSEQVVWYNVKPE